MKTTEETARITVLNAEEGHWITNRTDNLLARMFTKTLYLSDADDASNYMEVTDSEKTGTEARMSALRKKLSEERDRAADVMARRRESGRQS